MLDLTFITGNLKKVEYLSKYLGFPIKHIKLDLEEIQTLDLKEVVEHKVKQAYELVKSPVIVEDVSLEFEAFGRLPGTFIRFFVDEVPFENICSMVNGKSRKATAKSVFGYYDGTNLELFENSLEGEIAMEPQGEGGYGWDKIFIPKGYALTRASLNEEDDIKTTLLIKPYEKLKNYIDALGK